ncbi:putative ribonuclease h protein [Quercus suber]|uniref:Ribonuclease h protein n=1 Tax=Quercus suber TaxID=58331 RepID=A0AAW0K1T7_QUESU
MNRNFWWGFKDENKLGCCLKSWDSICTPKSVGGLGIRKTEDMNKALVAKMAWEIVSNVDKRWVQIFKKKYVKHRNFMNMPSPKGASWAAQSIFECRVVVKKGMCHKIGNGLNTWIWEDPWIPDETNLIPRRRNGATLEAQLVAEMIDQDTRQWDRGKLHELFEPNTVTKIMAIHINQLSQQDQPFWCLNPASEFTVKSAYNALRVSNYPHESVLQSKDWKELWKLKVHPRLKNSLWKMAWEILPTTSVLNSRFSLSSLNCYLCNNAVESLEHIFLHCDWVAQMWFTGPWPLNMSHMHNVSIIDWVKMIINPKLGLCLEGEEAKDFQLYAAILCDQIWLTRNKARMKGIKNNPEQVVR